MSSLLSVHFDFAVSSVAPGLGRQLVGTTSQAPMSERRQASQLMPWDLQAVL
jgi:hypothetical protein